MKNFISKCTTKTVERILEEKSIFEDENIFVVEDANKITNSHLLVMSRENVSSFSDAENLIDLVGSFAKCVEQLSAHDLFFFEKGRDAFCTSMGSHHHAHGHFFSQNDLSSQLLDKFSFQNEATSFPSLLGALSFLRKNKCKYIIAGTVFGECLVAVYGKDQEMHRRYMRNFIERHKL
jgi:diadenosine tetraphosphate (Ap4A) HIT family hydrolase